MYAQMAKISIYYKRIHTNTVNMATSSTSTEFLFEFIFDNFGSSNNKVWGIQTFLLLVK